MSVKDQGRESTIGVIIRVAVGLLLLISMLMSALVLCVYGLPALGSLIKNLLGVAEESSSPWVTFVRIASWPTAVMVVFGIFLVVWFKVWNAVLALAKKHKILSEVTHEN
ncbi:MAG: hypothetical protein AAF333_16610 [Planctomycetota bacterium]